MKKIFAVTLPLFFVDAALAADGGLPFWTITSQLANVAILVAIIYFTQRKNITQAFKQKRADFLERVNSASKSKQKAEALLSEVNRRLEQMKASYGQQVEEAKKNAEESYRTQVADAKNAAEKVKSMAQTSLEFEIQKQVENLRVETFQKSADLAEQKLESELTPEQLKVWNSRFSEAKAGVH